ncbi:MAG: TadE/TadG family type IV pilus assembly protein [Rhodanobacter sp.]
MHRKFVYRASAEWQYISRQRGVVAIEFALVFLFGMLPLLLLTLSGVLIFAAQQSLTLAAAEGARAALHYGTTAQRETNACEAAVESMAWLLSFSGETANCAAPSAPGGGTYYPVTVSAAATCPDASTVQCMTVQTSFDYNNHPFIPGTTTVYSWLMSGNMTSSATVQLDISGD